MWAVEQMLPPLLLKEHASLDRPLWEFQIIRNTEENSRKMESKRGTQSYEAFPMKSGDDEYSYAQNSNYQQSLGDMTKKMIKEAILEKLDLEALFQQHSSSVFCIVDLGCSVGPNTFFAVQNIIEAVNLKLLISKQHDGLEFENPLEFQVFFNDHMGNDFNTLFKSFPEHKQYYAAAVPGSFYNRLFPNSSIHFFYSSFAIGYLSQMPKEIMDKYSPAYNKGNIYHTNATNKKVSKAYSAQFARDMESFLNARASELVPGGLVAFLILSATTNLGYDRLKATINLFEDALLELNNKGLIRNELVQTFNLPFYIPTLEEVKELVEINGNFKIEKLQSLDCDESTSMIEMDSHASYMHVRAAWEGIFRKHFGEEVVDEIFQVFKKKVAESTIFTSLSYNKQWGDLFIIKRNFI